jgi:hypothetical protein
MNRQQAIARLLILCPFATELDVDRALDNAVIRGADEVGRYRVSWSQEEGFILPAAASGPSLHEGLKHAAVVAGQVPGLLGFRPEMSVVVVGAASSGRAVPTLRYDLPESPQSAAEIAEHAASVLAASGADAATVICYGPAEAAIGAAAAFRERLPLAGLQVTGMVRCADGFPVCRCLCGDPSCEASAPVPVLSPGFGRVLPDRAALAATLAPVTGPAAAAADREIQDAAARATVLTTREVFERGYRAVSGAISAYRAGGQAISGRALAELAVPLSAVPMRDIAWAWMDPEFAADHQRLWTDVMRQVPPRYRAAPASLLAFTAWQQGNGALANIALDRALEAEPDYSMAQLLRQALDSGAPPSVARLPMSPEQVAESYGLPAPPSLGGRPRPVRSMRPAAARRRRLERGMPQIEAEGPLRGLA